MKIVYNKKNASKVNEEQISEHLIHDDIANEVAYDKISETEYDKIIYLHEEEIILNNETGGLDFKTTEKIRKKKFEYVSKPTYITLRRLSYWSLIGSVVALFCSQQPSWQNLFLNPIGLEWIPLKEYFVSLFFFIAGIVLFIVSFFSNELINTDEFDVD